MKLKNLLALAVFIFVFGLVSQALAEKPEQNKAPKLSFPENTYKFDTVLDGAEVTHDFAIKNEGNAPLTVEKVKTG